MSDAIGPGTWVECVDADGTCGMISVGVLYQVRKVVEGYDGNGVWGVGLRLEGLLLPATNPPYEDAWRVERFRPVRSDISEIERILTQPIPADVQRERVPA